MDKPRTGRNGRAILTIRRSAQHEPVDRDGDNDEPHGARQSGVLFSQRSGLLDNGLVDQLTRLPFGCRGALPILRKAISDTGAGARQP